MNASTRIGVGIIGATPDGGWAANAHIPALRLLADDYVLNAISTSRAESARAAAEKFGVADAFDNHHDLVNHPGVDLVIVSVKVPHHRTLVEAALQAGKHVYCEWPLALDVAEAESLTAQAEARGVVAAVGLQARAAPAVACARQMIADGAIGRVLSTTLVASGWQWGDQVQARNAYINDGTTGATMLSIPFGHTVDALCWCLGEFASLNATLAVRRPTVTIMETGETFTKTAADQIAVAGVLDSGAVAAIHYRGGLSRGVNFLWEINGSEGDLQLTAANGQLQMTSEGLLLGRGDATNLEPVDIPAAFRPVDRAAGVGRSLAQALALLARDLRTGSRHVPRFSDAVVRHRMLEAVLAAAASGSAQRYAL